MRVVWAPLAIERAAATRWIETLVRVVASLGVHPRRGRRVPELARDDLREVFHGEYRVIYRIDTRSSWRCGTPA